MPQQLVGIIISIAASASPPWAHVMSPPLLLLLALLFLGVLGVIDPHPFIHVLQRDKIDILKEGRPQQQRHSDHHRHHQ